MKWKLEKKKNETNIEFQRAKLVTVGQTQAYERARNNRLVIFIYGLFIRRIYSFILQTFLFRDARIRNNKWWRREGVRADNFPSICSRTIDTKRAQKLVGAADNAGSLAVYQSLILSAYRCKSLPGKIRYSVPVINLAPYLKRGETVPDPSSLAPIFPFDPQNDPPTGFPLIHRITSVHESVRVDETFTRFVPFIYFLFCLYGIDPRLGIMDNAGYPCSKSFRVTKVATDGHRVTMNPKSGTDLYSAIIDPGNIFHSRSSVQGYLTSRLHGTLTHRAENGIRRWIGNCNSHS